MNYILAVHKALELFKKCEIAGEQKGQKNWTPFSSRTKQSMNCFHILERYANPIMVDCQKTALALDFWG